MIHKIYNSAWTKTGVDDTDPENPVDIYEQVESENEVRSLQRPRGPRGTFQVSIVKHETEDVVSITLQGRSEPNAPWVDIITMTASGGAVVALFPQMQVSGTVADEAAVQAWLAE